MPRGGTYADNAYNRSVGRAGMPMGSCVISSGGSGSSGRSSSSGISSSYSTPTRQAQSYDSYNITSTPKQSVTASTPKTYTDNAFNRRHDRVGKEVGTAVLSSYKTPTKANSSTSSSLDDSGYGASPLYGSKTPHTSTSKQTVPASTPRTYKDNAFNRKLDRVGKEVGTAVYSKMDGQVKPKVYIDSSENRALNRVGLPRGCRPKVKNTDTQDSSVSLDVPYVEQDDFGREPIMDCRGPRKLFEDDYEDEVFHRQLKPPTIPALTTPEVPVKSLYPAEHTKEKTVDKSESIDFQSIVLKKKIGTGGFGEVYKAEWKGSLVAVKMLQVQNVSKKRLKDFNGEVAMFCGLEHVNIVQFFGACLEVQNLCIVMELMEMSLFDALHLDQDIELAEEDRLSIMKQTADGLGYLHQKKIAHCDLKTANVLLNYKPGACEVKIGDFGLSIIKANTETSRSCIDDPYVSKVGTPKTSAPEVLRGEILSANKMRIADVYSLGMIFYEIVYEAEPFYTLSYRQLCQHVGEKPGLLPEIPEEVSVNSTLMDLMRGCWEFEPDDRKNIKEVISELTAVENVFD